MEKTVVPFFAVRSVLVNSPTLKTKDLKSTQEVESIVFYSGHRQIDEHMITDTQRPVKSHTHAN